MPRSWLIALAGALFVALLAIAFMVGRESSRSASDASRLDEVMPTAPPPQARAPQVSQGAPPPSLPFLDDEPVRPSAPSQAAQAPLPRSASPFAEPSGVAEPPSATTSERATVAAYFSQIESYERQAKYWNNPQELAMALLSGGTKGDTSGIAKLLATQRTALSQIRSMTVPPPCQEHHQRTVALLGRAVALLESIEGSLASGNLEALLALSGESGRLESDTRAVDSLAAEIKSRYGLTTDTSSGYDPASLTSLRMASR